MELTRGIRREVQGKGRLRREWVYPVACPLCGEERYLRKCDAQRRAGSPCFRCSQKSKAHKGFAAAAAGTAACLPFRTSSARRLREYRLAHPSALEAQFAALLDAAGIAYERAELVRAELVREVWLQYQGGVYLIDFCIGQYVAVEIAELVRNGTWAHQCHQQRDAHAELVRKGARHSAGRLQAAGAERRTAPAAGGAAAAAGIHS